MEWKNVSPGCMVACEDGVSFMIKDSVDGTLCLYVRTDGSFSLMESRSSLYSRHNVENDMKRRAEMAMKEYRDLGSIWTGMSVLRKGA